MMNRGDKRQLKRGFWRDMRAALVVAAIAVPESLGFAAIAGLPLQVGLYSAVAAPLVFAWLGHSKRLIVGADSATATLVASGAGLIATVGSVEYIQTATLLGLLTGLVLLGLVVLRLDFLADLVSRPVMVGFLAGVGVQLIVTHVPYLLGITAQGSLLHHIAAIFEQIEHISLLSVLFASLTLAVLFLFRRSNWPSALLGITTAGLIFWLLNLQPGDVSVVGALPGGLPHLVIPQMTFGSVTTLLPTALSIALVILVQSSMVVRARSLEHDEPVYLRRDITALGGANIASALTQGMVVNGSPPRSLAADMAGGTSRRVGVYMALLVGVILLVGGGVFAYVPQSALAAVIVALGWRLINIAELRRIARTHRSECAVALVALLGVALFGVRYGILLAVCVALAERLRRQYRPSDEVLLRDGRLSSWAQQRLDQHYRHQSSPDGVLVYRFDSSLFFENSQYFMERIMRAIAKATNPVKSVIIDAGAIDTMDYTALQTMRQLYRQLSIDGVRLCLAHIPPPLEDQLRVCGLVELIGPENIFVTLNQAIHAQPQARRSVVAMVRRLKIPSNEAVVIGGGVLEVLGLRRTVDIDLVVGRQTYNHYRDNLRWQEYVQDNGKHILSRHGYNIMRSWMGKNLRSLRQQAFVQDGVAFMSTEDLIAAKRRLGRPKDMADIALLELYQSNRANVDN